MPAWLTSPPQTDPEAPAAGGATSRSLLLLLVCAAAVRVSLWAWFAGLPPRIHDENDYNELARTLISSGEFAYEPGSPVSLRPPLYPAFVAAVYSVAGLDHYQAVRLAQALLSLVNVWLLYLLGREVYSARVGLWLAGAFAFYPSLLGANNLLLTETLFTLLLTAACHAVVLFYRRERPAYLALAGLLLGLAALTRSVVWLSPPFLAVYVVLTARGPLSRRAVGAALLLAAFAATIAPWSVRNTRLQRTFVTIDVMGGRNFMMGNYQHTPLYRAWDAISLEGEQAWYKEVFATYPPEERRTQGQVDKLALRQGLTFVRENPGLTALRDVIKFFDFWGLERELVAGAKRGYFGPVPRPALLALAVLITTTYVAALFSAIFGALICPPADRRLHWYFLLVIAFICGMHTLVFGHSRYHLPLMPLVLLYSVAAWAGRGEIWEHRRGGRFALAVALCLVFVVGWSWNAIAGDWDQIRAMIGLGG